MGWLDDKIQQETDAATKKFLAAGKDLVDYALEQLNGVKLSVDTQPVKKAESVDLPEGFRG